MLQQEMNAENKEIRSKAYDLYAKHGFKDGNEFVDWLEAERQTGKQTRIRHTKQTRTILLSIVGILSGIVVILIIMLFKETPKMELSEKSLSDLKVLMVVLDPKPDEKVLIFGDVHFDYDKFTLNQQAKTLLDKDVQVLKENPKIYVRMAGYTSAIGTEEINQELSKKRANAVKNYLIQQGIAKERVTIIGYGRTKPALYEVDPGDINSKEAKANMRVLFEIVVK